MNKLLRYVFPNAQSRPVTLNFGMRMPAWYDILGLTANSAEVCFFVFSVFEFRVFFNF